MTTLDKIRELVKNKCQKEEWNYHILPVIKYSKLLAQELGADVEMAELGALMHDIGWIQDPKNDEDHEVSGQPIAEEILKAFNYPQNVIDEIKHVIHSHRGSTGPRPETLTAKIIANADAMAHFDAFPWLLKICNNDPKKGPQWLHDKMERDWGKITLPEAKEMVQKKYEAIKTVLEPMLNQK